MIGTIDLLVHHEGRFYILDYKSNNLGSSPERYSRRGMLDAMAREHYYLQYLIYTIAVHRYLRTRIPGMHTRNTSAACSISSSGGCPPGPARVCSLIVRRWPW